MKKYVIMLDYLLRQNPEHWPVSAGSDDLDSLRKVRQHDGSPALEPRSAFTMKRLEAKSLVNSNTNKTDAGAIYQSTATGG